MTLYFSGLMPHRLGRDFVLADGRPRPADPRVLEEEKITRKITTKLRRQVVIRQLVRVPTCT